MNNFLLYSSQLPGSLLFATLFFFSIDLAYFFKLLDLSRTQIFFWQKTTKNDTQTYQ